jgi:hypothetical protein
VLLIIDNEPLQREAWAEYHSARKRLDKATRDLHRHEQIDRPAYESWISRTFPVFLTTLRNLQQEVSTKARQVEAVQTMAAWTGRSLKKLWREFKEREANPEAFESDDDARDGRENAQESGDDDRNERDDDFSEEEERSHHRRRGRRDEPDFEPARPERNTSSGAAKDIYRRLVQLLHPDRGGEWTEARKRLWHEVQQAWSAGDADWLARLEIEWETANDALGPTSPLSRLRRAIEEVHAARRDTERKLRDYRGSPPWRFTLSEKKRDELYRRTAGNFEHDIEFLQKQLNHLNATIAAWEKPTRARSRRPRATDDFDQFGWWDEEA